MAISDVCKFEIKARVDIVQKEQQISRNKAIASLADELGLLASTTKTMDNRAKHQLGQITDRRSRSETYAMVETEMSQGRTKKEAAIIVSEKTGSKYKTIRDAYRRHQKNLTDKEKPIQFQFETKSAQKEHWDVALKKIDELTQYMMANCEVPAQIINGNIVLFKSCVDTLQIFCDQIQGE